MKKLEDLQIGDEVVFSTLIYACQLGEVVGVTRAYIVVASYDEFDHVYYYNKRTGKLRGFSGCKLFMVQVATEELKEKAKKANYSMAVLTFQNANSPLGINQLKPLVPNAVVPL